MNISFYRIGDSSSLRTAAPRPSPLSARLALKVRNLALALLDIAVVGLLAAFASLFGAVIAGAVFFVLQAIACG